ncbi:hypothetical protein VFPPC_12262 [Pochonia chlamydosporia 170]|uniref:DUF7730 domain-containing protein n=1 Tax=Pochonia chlamydosporia 170 TaxID=1380566 RepID=A0A179F0D2_METCM|nr:hypothetical protein VFPPC_12262 [Pochonia chlamydosporia 170]OAQ58896.2 hypothetical protein VFPPC_12262 [Pochonia chlamydosporia 170]
MGFLDHFRSKKGTASGKLGDSALTNPSPLAQKHPNKYEDPVLSKKPLTPREIEEPHAKLYPKKHEPKALTSPRPPFDPLEYNGPLAAALAERGLAASNQRTYTQSQSLLFSRLPREMRMQLWRFAIGSQKLYLTIKKGRLVQAQKITDDGWWPKRDLLNVPLVCRAAYVESIAYLYSSNTFCDGFGYEGTKQPFTLLPNFLLPEHIASIKHIEFGWHFALGYSQYFDSHPQAWDPSITICAPNGEEVWRDVWAKLARLPHLKTLRVAVWASGDQRTQLIGKEEELLAPLAEMKHVEHFHIILPREQEDGSLWKDALFSISREFQNVERYG